MGRLLKLKRSLGCALLAGAALNAKADGLDDRIAALRATAELAPVADMDHIARLAQKINPPRWKELWVNFYEEVLKAREMRASGGAIGIDLLGRDAELPADWYKEPWYYAYVQYFGTPYASGEANFDDLARMLPYLQQVGIRNIYLLPHYRSPRGDGGYDVSAYEPDEKLGGRRSYLNFMKRAADLGFRVATDAVYNHTSVEHDWFKKALAGDAKYLSYYLKVDAWKDPVIVDRNGDLWAQYWDTDAQGKPRKTERILIFPDVARDHFLKKTVTYPDGTRREHKFYREFYPFQVDLDLQNPAVLREILEITGNELNEGVLGKRTDAIAHWIKRMGTTSDGLPESFAVQMYLKAFLKAVSPRAIIIPEAVRGTGVAARYLGAERVFGARGEASTEGGDAMFNFETQGSLREALYFADASAVWDHWERALSTVAMPASATWVNLLGHHDETYIGFFRDGTWDRVRAYIRAHDGVVYKNGMSGGGRYANFLGNDPARISNAFFMLYALPGTPAVYFGDEIGWQNNPAHAAEMKARQAQILEAMGVTGANTDDPRELQRGPVPRSAFEGALAHGYLPLQTLKALNALRARHAALRGALLTKVETGNPAVFAALKATGNVTDPSFLALANLGAERVTVRLPARSLGEDVLARETGLPAGVALQPAGGDAWEATLEPFAHALLPVH